MVLLSVIADSYDNDLPFFLIAAFGTAVVQPPALCESGRVSKGGKIFAKVARLTGAQQEVLYVDEIALCDDFRRLADRLKLSDAERIEMFVAVKKWIVCDYRLDPTMDPKDPDAKRLVH